MMEILTIQNRAVVEQIIRKGIYIADYSRVPENRKKPYMFMAEQYNWSTCPVFGSIVGKKAELYGVSNEDAVALCLNVPEEFAKVQNYYDWSDFIYFSEFAEEFPDTYDTKLFPTVSDWGKFVLLREQQNIKYESALETWQASFPFIKKEWIVSITENTAPFFEKHYGTGGRNVLNLIGE